MKAFLIAIATLVVGGCGSVSCPQHPDEASCSTDKLCHWNKKESRCKDGADTTPSTPMEAPAPETQPAPTPETHNCVWDDAAKQCTEATAQPKQPTVNPQ
jgi:hypothetical protein